ncbi:MAG: hypothetical protein ABWZ40_05305 [Caulobacterales bacterium]
MRFRIFALLSTALLALGCASAPKNDFDPFALEIEAGRWGVMNAQSAAIIADLPPSAHPLDETDIGRRAALAAELRQSTLEFARLKSWACRDEKLSKATCAEDFSPAWIGRKETAPPSWAELQKRSDAVGAAVMPMWDELCAQAKAKAPNEEPGMICPME